MQMTYTVTGLIAPVTGSILPSGTILGTDGGGYFTTPGASLAGLSYSVTWTANDCECIGTPNFGPLANHYPNPNPIFDVALTINNHTYDFGPLGWYGEFYLTPQLNIQQTGYLDGGSFISTSVGFAQTPNVLGEFEIVNNMNYTTQITSGLFITAPVPAPLIGSGLPALPFALVALLLWRHGATRRAPTAIR